MSRRVLWLGLLAFVIAVVVVLPARWAMPLLPAGVECEKLAGSIWAGRCTGLTISTGKNTSVRVDTMRWRVAPSALLRLKLRAELELAIGALPDVHAAGTVELARDRQMKLQQGSYSGKVDHALLGALPAGWTAHVVARDVEVELHGDRLLMLRGKLRVQSLQQAAKSYDNFATARPLGSYELDFTNSVGRDAPPFVGSLRSTDGPVAVDGRITVEADRSWQLQGFVTAAPGSDPELYRQLDLLGPADLNGRRPLSVAGSFSAR
jgi:hypothetical protein